MNKSRLTRSNNRVIAGVCAGLAEWLGWDGFNRFWTQSVRWAMRDVKRSDFRVETKAKDGKGIIRVDAVDDEGNFVNFLRPEGVVAAPGTASESPRRAKEIRPAGGGA